MVYNGRDVWFEWTFLEEQPRRYDTFGHALVALQRRYHLHFNRWKGYEGAWVGAFPAGYAPLFSMRMLYEGEMHELQGPAVCELAFKAGYNTDYGVVEEPQDVSAAVQIVEHFLRHGTYVRPHAMNFAFRP